MTQGKVGYRDGIAILQVIVFACFLPAGIWFKVSGRLGWFGVTFISLIRIIGASCMLATIGAKDADGLWTGVVVCESFGILVLFFLLLEMLERLNHFAKLIPRVLLLVPHVIVWASIGVSIAGFVAMSRTDDPLAPTAFSQAGTAVTALLCVFEAGMFLYMFFAPHVGRHSDGDGGRRIFDLVPNEEELQIHCLVICLPLLGLRVLYSLLYIVTEDQEAYSPIVGSPTLYLIFTALAEITVVAACIWTVMHMPVIDNDAAAGQGLSGTVRRLFGEVPREQEPYWVW
ncbi:uncharacterized protein PG998_005498 [Apiospora kogelbergensis]|uniref:uncharacterized protein n=1 Tax=Apiospora kogelbergensis TaxID=1337665 RepID=UPI00312F210E